jgi:hypothetical protein
MNNLELLYLFFLLLKYSNALSFVNIKLYSVLISSFQIIYIRSSANNSSK